MFGFGGGRRRRGGPGGPGFGPGGLGPGGFGPFMHRFGGGCGRGGSFLKDLDLTEEQLEKIAELKVQGMSHFAQVKSSMGSLMSQMMRELSQDQIDKAKVRAVAKQIQECKSKAGDEFLERVITFAEVLTPEQRKRVRMKAIKRFLGVDSDEHHHGEQNE